MGELAVAIQDVLAARSVASTRLKQACAIMEPKRADGRLSRNGKELVAQLIEAGLSNKDIADALGISSAAVTHHRRQVSHEDLLIT